MTPTDLAELRELADSFGWMEGADYSKEIALLQSAVAEIEAMRAALAPFAAAFEQRLMCPYCDTVDGHSETCDMKNDWSPTLGEDDSRDDYLLRVGDMRRARELVRAVPK